MDAKSSAGVPLSSPAAAQRCAEGAGLDSGAPAAAQSAMPSIATSCRRTDRRSLFTNAAAPAAPQLQSRISTSLTDVTKFRQEENFKALPDPFCSVPRSTLMRFRFVPSGPRRLGAARVRLNLEQSERPLPKRLQPRPRGSSPAILRLPTQDMIARWITEPNRMARSRRQSTPDLQADASASAGRSTNSAEDRHFLAPFRSD